ncbi:1125_t:CDS:1, partial [Funneliformis mosseae]
NEARDQLNNLIDKLLKRSNHSNHSKRSNGSKCSNTSKTSNGSKNLKSLNVSKSLNASESLNFSKSSKSSNLSTNSKHLNNYQELDDDEINNRKVLQIRKYRKKFFKKLKIEAEANYNVEGKCSRGIECKRSVCKFMHPPPDLFFDGHISKYKNEIHFKKYKRNFKLELRRFMKKYKN